MDGEPWSPELLDWLASDFVEHRYDVKRLIATILTSRAYQMPAVARTGEPPTRGYVFARTRGPPPDRRAVRRRDRRDHRRMERLSGTPGSGRRRPRAARRRAAAVDAADGRRLRPRMADGVDAT